ncbi:MAG: hypothetical protein AAF141_05635 [Pseudomonadota bacterium]
MSRQNEATSAGGVGFFGLLALLFIGLKLGDVIQWSWLWVLSPLWLPIAFGLLIMAVGLLMVGAYCLIERLIK